MNNQFQEFELEGKKIIVPQFVLDKYPEIKDSIDLLPFMYSCVPRDEEGFNIIQSLSDEEVTMMTHCGLANEIKGIYDLRTNLVQAKSEESYLT